MTPDKIEFVIQALHAAGLQLSSYLALFPPESVAEARELYARYYMPVEQQQRLLQQQSGQ
jgi:hypothetical protein